ncbi:hypothetical protein U9M48_018887 [Paspalum notatum var. saurae]|uniref:Calcium permeable stress-gated cation channel 1 n=1 Tax=Paspalum notatum var. saurae TaxID=547442 RepID=A0AAQ3TCV2_PASNO
MATIRDIGLSAAINILSAVVFLLAFAFLRLQPINDRVYFPKWYLKGARESPTHGGAFVRKFVNLDMRSYFKFLSWMPAALKMPEDELISHAGLDSAIYLRIYLVGLKIFAPISILAFIVLVPVNWTNDTLDLLAVQSSNIDKLSISNIPARSKRFIAHLTMAYVFTFWTCYVLLREYEIVAKMRLRFLASEKRRPDQFTVLVRNIPPDPDESIGELVEHFFLVNHPDHYLTHQVVYNANKLAKLVKEKTKMQNWLDYYQLKFERNASKRPTTKTGFLGCFGSKVDAIEYYTSEIERIESEEAEEREKIVKDPKSVVPAAFVSFRSRWGAAVCAQTQQTSNPTVWLTEWAPEPRDVYWDNLSIPFVSLTVRRLIVAVAFFFLNFFYVIPIAFVQSLANLEGIEKAAPFLKPLIEVPTIKSFIQGFLPGIALKIFLILLPTILMFMSKVEGLTSISSLERRSASKYYIFLFFNVFLASIIAGSALEQLKSYIHQSANEYVLIFATLYAAPLIIVIPKTIGVAIPMKATFFITYIMVDGWAGVAGEILRLKPLIINVYNQEYESAAAFWPSVHGRIITALIVSQLLLLGLLSTKGAGQSTPVLLVLPVVTFYFHKYCKNRYEPTFVKCPLQEAMKKDTLERAREPGFDIKGYLINAYIHPVFKGDDDDEKFSIVDETEAEQVLVPTKRQSRRNTPVPSKYNGSESPSLPEIINDQRL